jgi:hypothetical protein
MSTTRLHLLAVSRPWPSLRYRCLSSWSCGSPQTTREKHFVSVLATGTPISVVPWFIQNALTLQVTPVTVPSGPVPRWYGIPCDIGRVTLWLPVDETPGQNRDFSLLVLLPRADLTGALPYVYLGAQFLLEYRVQVALDGATSGRLVIP